MKVSVIGSEGVVGGAAKFGFELLGHEFCVFGLIIAFLFKPDAKSVDRGR